MTETKVKAPSLACFCNHVQNQTVRTAIAHGANTLAKIYDQTGAGSGPCGGSCRIHLHTLIAESLPPTPHKTSQTVLAPELIEAISLFNRHFFWEAHEVLEKIWLEEHGELKKFYQGIIQASACCYHVLNANPKGALKLSLDAREKLLTFAPNYLEINLEGLCQRLQEFHDEAKEILGKTKAGFSYELLPKINIGDFKS